MSIPIISIIDGNQLPIFNEIYVKIISKNFENSHPSFRRRVHPCLKRGWEIDKYMISNIKQINQDINMVDIYLGI